MLFRSFFTPGNSRKRYEARLFETVYLLLPTFCLCDCSHAADRPVQTVCTRTQRYEIVQPFRLQTVRKICPTASKEQARLSLSEIRRQYAQSSYHQHHSGTKARDFTSEQPKQGNIVSLPTTRIHRIRFRVEHLLRRIQYQLEQNAQKQQ